MFEGCRGPNNCILKCPFAPSSFAHMEVLSLCKASVQGIMGGGPKCLSVVPFEISDSKGPFEVASFEYLD